MMARWPGRPALGAAVALGLLFHVAAAAAQAPAAQALAAQAPAAQAPAAAQPAGSASARAQRPPKSVRGKLEAVDRQLNGIIMTTDDGRRVAWKFAPEVIARLEPFKSGDPVIVIYRQRASDKVVTAVAFPGTADQPVYVNTAGERVELVGGPIVDGVCGQPSDQPLSTVTIPVGGQAEVADACWCCAPAGETCLPANRTGAGRAFLTHCSP